MATDLRVQAAQDQLDAEVREMIRKTQRLQRVMYALSAGAALLLIWSRW